MLSLISFTQLLFVFGICHISSIQASSSVDELPVVTTTVTVRTCKPKFQVQSTGLEGSLSLIPISGKFTSTQAQQNPITSAYNPDSSAPVLSMTSDVPVASVAISSAYISSITTSSATISDKSQKSTKGQLQSTSVASLGTFISISSNLTKPLTFSSKSAYSPSSELVISTTIQTSRLQTDTSSSTVKAPSYSVSPSLLLPSTDVSSPTKTFASLSSSSISPGKIRIPTITYSSFHGPATYSPASQYLSMPIQSVPAPLKLSPSILKPLNNPALQDSYPLSPAQGLLQVTPENKRFLRNLQTVPWYSRDGGHGGKIGNVTMFVFADTMSFKAPKADGTSGGVTGFVSNSIGVDVGQGPKNGLPLTIQDPIGAMAGPWGNQRNVYPSTTGEIAATGNGIRYCIWSWSSFVSIDATKSIVYAPLVMINRTGDHAAGTTLMSFGITSDGQPIVNRKVNRLFGADTPQFGAMFGARGCSGYGGKVYAFGTSLKGPKGLVVGRTDPENVSDATTYEYYTNSSGIMGWTSDWQSASIAVPITMTSGDIFYAPAFKTYIMVYAMNLGLMYYSYLKAASSIVPTTTSDGICTDIMENIFKYQWSKPVLMLNTWTTGGSYSYDGGVLQGYFDDDDITNGGNCMLVHWSAQPGGKAGNIVDAYQFRSAKVCLGAL